MRKWWILVFIICFAAGCGKGPQEEVSYEEVSPETAPSVSAGYAGVYEGLLPAASGPGIQTRVTLQNDGTFEWRSEYIGEQDGVFTDKGAYILSGDLVSLEVPGEGIRYAQVGNGLLRLLDQDKAVITGNLADMYVLKKIK